MPRETVGHLSMAYHEAAHAVLAWRTGLEVDFLKLDYGWFTGQLLGGHVRVRSDFDEETAMSWGITSAAGAVAQERFLLERGYSAPHAARIAEFGGSLDAEDMNELVREFEVSALACHRRAEVLVDAHWAQIGEIAQQLLDRGRLRGKVAR